MVVAYAQGLTFYSAVNVPLEAVDFQLHSEWKPRPGE